MGADGTDIQPKSADSPLSGTDTSIGHPELRPRRDEGTPVSDAAALKPEGPAAADSPGSAELTEIPRPVVIGEQQDRVIYAAGRFGAETYSGLSAEEAGLREGSAELKDAQLEHNAAWISQMRDEGRLIIDTGPAEPRGQYPEPTRPSDWPAAPYEVELSAIEDYPNVIRPWEDMTGTPNFPWKYDSSTYQEEAGYYQAEQDTAADSATGAADSPLSGTDTSIGYPDLRPHRDEGTPASDAAAPKPEDPAASDSPGGAEMPASHPIEAPSAPTRDEATAPAGPLEMASQADAPSNAGEGAAPTPMDKWEASEDRRLAGDIIAHRKQQDILRQQQGNEQGAQDGAQDIEDFISKLPTTDAIKADPQGYLDGLGDDEVSPSAPDTQTEKGGEPDSAEPELAPADRLPDDWPSQDSDGLAPATDAPGAGEQGESSRWLMQLHVEGPRGPIDDRPGYHDPDGIRTDRYWMPVDDLVTNDPRVANGNWAELCDRLDIPADDQLRSLYAANQMVKEWDLVAAQHGLPPDWGARTQVTFARVPDNVAISATPVDPARYAPWSAGGGVESFPQSVPTGSGPGEQGGGDGEATFSYRGIPMPMGSEVHLPGRLDTPESVDTPPGSNGESFDEAWIHGPPHEAPELADRVIAAADAAAGGDPLGRSIEIAQAMSDQTFRIDSDQDPPVVVRDDAGNLQDGDQRYREGGVLPAYGDDGRIMGTGSTDENEVTGERVALGGGEPSTSDRFRFNDQTGAVSPESVPVWESSDAMFAAHQKAEAEYESGMDPAKRAEFVQSLRHQADRQREQGNEAAASSIEERIRLLDES